MRTKLKIIREQGKIFLIRFTIYLKTKSIKIHFILNDDKGEAHSHPWDFKSLLLIPYKEELKTDETLLTNYDIMIGGVLIKGGYTLPSTSHKIRHGIFTIVKRSMKLKHRVSLYRIFGIKIPALTIGMYSEKKQLCSLCQEAGYCKSNKK